MTSEKLLTFFRYRIYGLLFVVIHKEKSEESGALLFFLCYGRLGMCVRHGFLYFCQMVPI